jgi:hypothetical protein
MTVYEIVKKIQNRPYEERMRVFWFVSAAGFLLVAAVWIALGSFSPKLPSDTNQLAQEWQKGTENAKRGFTEMQRQISEQKVRALLPDGRAVTMTNYAVNANTGLLTVELEINNPTSDILNITDANQTNVYLVDGDNRLVPQSFVLDTGQAVPQKLLNHTSISVQTVFSKPQEKTFTLYLTGLSFENNPDSKFTESFELSGDGQVQGLQQIVLPRQ